MSGFEIVGVVLGGLPLVIKAAEGYKKGLEPMMKWHRYKLEFRAFVHDVDIERQMFEALVERLLQYTDLSMEQKDMLRKGEDLDGWCQAETEKALRKRLGESFDACKYLLEALKCDLIKLQTMLSLKDGSVDWARPGEDKWHYQRKRIAHSFSKKGPETIGSLSKNIKRFRDLLDVLDERIGTAKQDQRKAISNDTTWAKIFECIRKQALSLHAALKNGWKCTCDAPHMTSLQLQRRATGEWSSQFILAFLPPPNSKSWGPKRKFSVAVRQTKTIDTTTTARPTPGPLQEGYLNKLKSNVELSSPASSQLAFYKESDFRTKSSPTSTSSFTSLRKALRSSSSVTSSGNSCPPVTPGANCMSPPIKTKHKKSVGWNVPSSSGLQIPLVQHSHSTPNLLPPSLPPPPKDPPEQPEEVLEIIDLCSTLATCDPNTSCIGYLTCPGNHHHEFRSLKNPEQASSPTQDLISLEALLKRTQPGLKLTRKQQYRLTVILASSLLQLQTTPWMTGKLEKKDIFFEYFGFEVFAEQPYISHSFPYIPPPTPSTASALRFATRASLVQLGIILLELCFGETIESQTHLRTRHLVNGQPHNDTDFLTARDWILDVEQEAGTGFQDAIKCCMNFDGKPDWGDTKFMQGIYDGVVKPLEGVLGDYGWGDEIS